jgi:hypothetical protein
MRAVLPIRERGGDTPVNEIFERRFSLICAREGPLEHGRCERP